MKRIAATALALACVLATPVWAALKPGDTAPVFTAQAALDGSEAFDPRKAVTQFLEYQASHPEFAAGVATWVTVGILLFVLGTLILIWSETHAMLGLSNLSAPRPRAEVTRTQRCALPRVRTLPRGASAG